jgi:hypothetical protein
MVRIEIDGAAFEAETMREARKLASKAEREAKRAEAARAASRAVAMGRAESAAFHLYDVGLRPGGPPRGLRFYAADDRYFGSDRVRPNEYGETMKYETSEGDGTFVHSGYRVHGCIRNGAGFDVAVVLSDTGAPDRFDMLAVGIEDGIVALALLQNLDWHVFARQEGSET